MRIGDRCRVTYKGRTLDARVEFGSDNRNSLMLAFDGILGGYICMMPVFRDEGGIYRDLVMGEEVGIEMLPVTAEIIAEEMKRMLTEFPVIESITIHLDVTTFTATGDPEKAIRDLLTPAENERIEIQLETPRVQ